ncbi:hypothetical protein BDP81DRAFT_397215 [Colletotrichum phormii]|uniref:Uncharacterized protein n=1 Tax=Colletotrichum phormii TaxID=359342 RepID=A0AAI9ZJU9_9PEZI|nr:uncharacterized protein BDP81DRAFT_397215 [Colletotrichum phormii]KAK1633316.1 hypothetical protein BDP81DRAFT_397215 [Colletotrichum phormii]
MFLIKVAVKYGGDLIEPDRVWNLTTSLVQHFRSLPAGRWHLANLMAPGLERMARTLKSGRGETSAQVLEAQPLNGDHSEVIDPQLAGSSADGTLMGPEEVFFFDYDMSFGLSPVFQFDMTSLNADGTTLTGQDFSNVEYQMGRPGS